MLKLPSAPGGAAHPALRATFSRGRDKGVVGTCARVPEFLRYWFNGGEQMPAKSKSQQMAAGAALSAKKGEKKKSELKGASKSMAESMSKKELEELASTDRKKLPDKKNK